MITLTGAMTAALGVNYPSPGVFVELGFSSPERLHDRQGSKSWTSLTWSAADIRVDGFSVVNGAAQSCSITIVDASNGIAQKCRTEAIGLPVKIWLFDASALATGDPLQIFSGIMGAPSGADNRRVKIDCTLPEINLPRGMLGQILPAYMLATEGSKVVYGNGTLVFARRGEYA